MENSNKYFNLMKTTLITFIVLSLMTINNLVAQTLFETWNALKEAGDGKIDPTSSEAIAIKDAILAQEQISLEEVGILQFMTTYNANRVLGTGYENWYSLARENTSKSPVFAAIVKAQNNDTSNWTDEMIQQGFRYVVYLAARPDASQSFRDRVWLVAKNKALSEIAERNFFKAYRATQPLANQIEISAKQKELLLAIPKRTEMENAWLAEISADLIALQIDQ
jgi:hypothetical protein